MTAFMRRAWNATNPFRCVGKTAKGKRCRNNGVYLAEDGWRCRLHREVA